MPNRFRSIRLLDSRNRSQRVQEFRRGSRETRRKRSGSIGTIDRLAQFRKGLLQDVGMRREAVEQTAAQAVAIARASARVKQHDVRLASEKPANADWATPIEIDPFNTSIEQNLDLLLKIDSELRAVSGITLAEANMNFQREES